jgi:hypothetical protein
VRKLTGRVRHQDVLTTLGNEVLGQQRRSLRFGAGSREDLQLPPGHVLRTMPAPASWLGLAIDALPSASRRDVVVVMVVRRSDGREQVLAATPDLVVDADDQVVVMGEREAVARLQALGRDEFAEEEE